MEATQPADEERPLIERPQQPKTRQSWKGNACLVVVAVCLLLLQVSWLVSSFLSHDGPQRHAGEHISWYPCGELNLRPVECSSIDVPMDHFDAENSGNKTFSIPLVRSRGGKNATRNLLLNPGGPGIGAHWMLLWRGQEIRSIVGEDFHLLAFDPRGVNSSTPLATCYPDAETRKRLSNPPDAMGADDSVQLYAWTQNFVKACRDTSGEHGLYVNTPQTAADLNSILDALGQKDMYYWGFSYGTLLGQTYATMFPDRAKRMILDGVVNQFAWYENRTDWEAMADTDKVLHGFYDECLKAGPETCALASLAGSREALAELVNAKVESMKEQPIPVYVDNSKHGILTFDKLWFNGVRSALYDPQSWTALAANLAGLLRGNATAAYLAYGGGQETSSELTDESNRFVMLNDGLSGSEHWPQQQDRHSLLGELAPLMNQSSFSLSALPIYYAKQQWLLPRTHAYTPRRGVKTAGPVLILSTTFDPICPLVSAQSANDAFEGSRIVEVQGYGHCSMAVTSACAGQYVREFLLSGTVPETNTLCEVDSSYFVRLSEERV